MNSPEYETARLVCNAASREFAIAESQYRARLIDDAEFLAARAKHIEAQGVFDDALLAELNRSEVTA